MKSETRNQLSPGGRRLRRPAQSGAAVLVSLVVILALSGLGVIALTASLTSTRASANANLMAQGRLALQPAVAASLRLLDDVNFATAMTSGFRASAQMSESGLVLEGGNPFPGAIFASESATLRGTVFGAPDDVVNASPGDAERDVNMRFRRHWPPVPVAGFEVGTFCRERIRVNGTVVVASRGARQFAMPGDGGGGSGGQDIQPDPDPGATGDFPADQAAQSANRFSLVAFTPPVACEGY